MISLQQCRKVASHRTYITLALVTLRCSMARLTTTTSTVAAAAFQVA